MDKINIIHNDVDLSNEKKQIVDELLKVKVIKQKMDELNIDINTLYESPFSLVDYHSNIVKCAKCKSLDTCTQKLKGYFTDIDADLELSVKPCKYLKTDHKKHGYQTNIIINYMPKQYQSLDLFDIDAEKEDSKYQTILLDIIRWVKNPTSQGFYLCGDVGVGKTYLVSCVANLFAKNNKKVGFIYLNDWILYLKSLFGYTSDNILDEIEKAKKVDLLILDDIGAENFSVWSRDEIIFPILNYRAQRGMKTLFTSNIPQELLAKRYKNADKNNQDEIVERRILDRIKTLSKEYLLEGNNRRHY